MVPLTIFILAFVFYAQKHGTASIGKIFGPIILLWFTVLGALGVYGILKNPDVFNAFNPMYAVYYFQEHGFRGFSILSAVFLVMTGGEALYADMGHVGRNPIQRAWFMVVLPGLVLNYLGQGALLLSNPEANKNTFFLLAPSWALYPLVLLATMATVIASQALISGVFSMTRQAIQLGYVPRMQIKHTSAHEIGQIYIPYINWTLFILSSWCVMSFGSSSALASAYGVAVSSTMVITTILVCSVAAQRWKWNLALVIAIATVLILIESAFFFANIVKIADGGWVPLAVAVIVFILMTTWKTGRKILVQRLRGKAIPLVDYLEKISHEKLARISGTAIFMTGDPEGTPLALVHNVRANKCLHERNALLTIIISEDAHVDKMDLLEITEMRPDFYKIVAYYGFMQKPSIREVLRMCANKGCSLRFEDAIFFLGRETVLASASTEPGMAVWREHIFSFLSRNAERATAYFDIPPDQVVEVGVQVQI